LIWSGVWGIEENVGVEGVNGPEKVVDGRIRELWGVAKCARGIHVAVALTQTGHPNS
jgi:hypothetical protein